MSFNTFGKRLRITTFGESHGPAIGVIIDGVPARLTLNLDAIATDLGRRRPGQSAIASPRKEPDAVELLSGVFEGQTTGAPIALIIANQDVRSEDYQRFADRFRPGHADLSYMSRYGVRDWRGGGRASGRETAARVAAGAVARQVLAFLGHPAEIFGHVVSVADVSAETFDRAEIENNPVRCADPLAAQKMIAAIEQAKQEKDSVGGVVEVRAQGVPTGLGQPVYNKLDAQLAAALMGIGAVKGVEIGDGFRIATLRGSQANDAIVEDGFASNHAGGVLGGISTGDELILRLAVKPTPSIAKPQKTINVEGQATTIAVEGRHDPCIAPRLVPVAEAMVALVLADALLAPPQSTGN